MLKLTLLSLSLLTIMAGAAVAPAIANIAAAFPDASETTVKLVLTIPAVFIIPFSLFSGRLSRRFSKKWMLIVSLSLYAIGGVGGGFAQSIHVLHFFRSLLGIAVGLLMPLSTGLIGDFFDGDEKAQMLGNSAAASNLGGVLATFSAGFLAMISWRHSFGVYGLSIVILILVILFLHEPPKVETGQRQKERIPVKVYLWAVAAFGQMLAFYTIPTNISIYMSENGFGNASITGFLISFALFSAFIASMLFKKIFWKFGRFFAPFILIIMVTGVYGLTFAPAVYYVFLSVIFTGTGMGLTMPFIYLNAQNAAGKGRSVTAMSLVTCMLFLGQFLSPIAVDFIGSFTGLTTPRESFFLVGTAILCLFIIAIFRALIMPKRSNA
ncbi:MFS transporter [Limisalsivibrio acetivorans]|uniref:MFS transporter n=1 Tax=Limisalsivibrio acetivorans TaxID=1304888 RepID=UPI0003B6F491|nr:MFS transporter [Limisalsivibrio acetivorans]